MPVTNSGAIAGSPVGSAPEAGIMPAWAWPAIAAAYAVLGAAGLAMALPSGYASPVFPAAGFALAILMHCGARALPAIWIGALGVNLVPVLSHSGMSTQAWLVSAGIASGACLQAWFGQRLVHRWHAAGWRTLEQEGEIVRFLLLAGPLACVVSAACGTATLHASGVIDAAQVGFTAWNWYVGDTLGVLVFAPLTLAVLRRRTPAWQGRFGLVAKTSLATLAVAAAAFGAVAHWESEDVQRALEERGSAVARILQGRFSGLTDAVSALARFVESTPDLGAQHFRHFAHGVLNDHRDLSALSFNPYVPAARRDEAQRQWAQGAPGGTFTITERDAEGRLVPAGARAEYVVVGYIAPLAGNLSAIGYDIHSDPVRRDAIQRARRTGAAAATEPLRLVQDARDHVGALILRPILRPSGELAGFAVGVVKVDQAVELALDGHLEEGLVYRIRDPAAAHPVVIAAPGGRPPPAGAFAWRT